MYIIYPIDHKGSMQSSYRDPESIIMSWINLVWSHLSALDD